jgi:hypothetical protein
MGDLLAGQGYRVRAIDDLTGGRGVRILQQNIDYWREAPVWDVPSIEAATKNWFAFLGERRHVR